MSITKWDTEHERVENALKLAFIKLQQTDGFRATETARVPDVQAYNQILDAIHTFDPDFNVGEAPTLAEIKKTPSELMEALEKLQHEYSNFGAEDSEPEYHRECVIRAAEEGEPFPLSGVNPWELYSSMSGWEDVSVMLTNTAREYYNARVRERLGF